MAVMTRIWSSLAISSLTLGSVVPVHAQDTIEEIIVTARKKEERLQEIPLSITAIPAEVLERKGIRDLKDIARLTPGMQYDTIFSPADTRVVIRGLSPTRGRPNVAFLQDGIDISSEAVASAGGSMLINPRLFDLERVEIVKGPQSALYGRTAFAGAINYVTKRPGDEFEGKASFDVGGDGQLEFTAGVSGPVVEDKLRLGINASVWEHDGYYSNTVTGADLGGEDGFGIAASAVFTPNDAVSVFARMEYMDDEFGLFPWAHTDSNVNLPIPPGAIGTVISPGVPGLAIASYAGEPADADQQVIRISPDPKTGADYPGSTREFFRTSLILDWDLAWGGTLSWQSYYADSTTSQVSENTRQGDVNTIPFFTLIDYTTDRTTWSQDLRLSSDQDQSVRWLVGANYWWDDAHQDDGGFACIILFVPFLNCGPFISALQPFPPRTFDRTETSTSFYAAVEFDINEQWSLALEGRYFDEEQSVWGPDSARVIDPVGVFPPFIPVTQFGPIGAVGAEASDSYFTPRATLEYTANEDALLYFSIAKGGKPAGISTVGAAAGPFEPERFSFDQEEVWVYEFGAKTAWLDGRLVANGALYYQDFSGKQASSQVILSNGLLGTKTVNASDAEVTGFEFDLAWAVTDMLTATVGYSYIDATYGDFKTTTGGPATIVNVGNCTPVVIAGSTLCEVDRSGNRLEDSSEHSLVLGLDLHGSLTPEIDWLVETDAVYTSDRFDTADNILSMPAYWLVDLRIGVRGDKWDVVAYADNLFDDDTVRTAFLSTDFGNISLVFAPPPFTFIIPFRLQSRMPDRQQIGIRATYRF